jgi:hypothetical protein
MPYTDVAANSFISRNLIHRNYKMFNPIETPMYFHILVPGCNIGIQEQEIIS